MILTRNEAITVLDQVLAVPATLTVRAIPTEVSLEESDGMPAPCALTVDNVTLVRPSLCTERIPTLSPARLRAVCGEPVVAIAC